MNLEQIYRLIDGDLEPGALGPALRALAASPDLREAVSVSQIIGDSMRGRAVEDDGYSKSIFAALDREVIRR